MPARRSIPVYALYGEQALQADALLHVEAIQSRSRRYRWAIDAHRHGRLHQLIWLQSGPASISLDGHRQDIAGPAVIVIGPGAVHGFRFAADSDGWVLTFAAAALIEGEAGPFAQALQRLFAAPRVIVPREASGEARQVSALLDCLERELRLAPAGSPVPAWLARSLVWCLARSFDRDSDAGASRRRHDLHTRFLALVDAHLLEHWPVARYAARLGLSPERLNRLTQAQAGRSALDVIHDRLAREACRRLVYVAAPIGRLAAELGFDDPAYFSRFVKRRTGASPRDYRRRHAGELGPDLATALEGHRP